MGFFMQDERPCKDDGSNNIRDARGKKLEARNKKRVFLASDILLLASVFLEAFRGFRFNIHR